MQLQLLYIDFEKSNDCMSFERYIRCQSTIVIWVICSLTFILICNVVAFREHIDVRFVEINIYIYIHMIFFFSIFQIRGYILIESRQNFDHSKMYVCTTL